MSNPRTGGRGKTAPYQTQHYRIPLPIKPVVQMLASTYAQSVGLYPDPTGEKLLKRVTAAISDSVGLVDQRDSDLVDEAVETDEDTDLDEDAEELDEDDSEPSDDEIIKAQAQINGRLQTDVRVLERELAEAQTQIDQLKAERQKALDILVPAFKVPSNAGGKIKAAIRKAFPELAN